jgi:hypothetical protein
MCTGQLFTFTTLALASLATAQWTGQPCGRKLAPCAQDATCVPDDPTCPDLNISLGHCEFINEYEDCGGFRIEPKGCPENNSCEDDPRKPWDYGIIADAPGICIPDDQPVCGGFAGFACPDGLFCYDILWDGCDPDFGGADCLGICL